MLKKFTSIAGAGVYSDFRWDEHVRHASGGRDSFMDVNIIYGRNYSGKTTLSRLMRAMQTGSMPEKLRGSTFTAEFDGGTASNIDLTSHAEKIRVFNDDFVRDNLSILFRDDGSIVPFAVLGEQNTKIQEEIDSLQQQIGENGETGLSGEHAKAVNTHSAAKSSLDVADRDLRSKLDEKANKSPNGIKHNKVYGDPNYKVPKLEQDLEKVLAADYQLLAQDTAESLRTLLREEAKSEIAESRPKPLQLTRIIREGNALLSRVIKPSQPIQELLNDSLLQAWVREGRRIHEGQRANCGFCGNAIPNELWGRLAAHFSRESEDLLASIRRVLTDVATALGEIVVITSDKTSMFYSEFHGELAALNDREKQLCASYKSALEKIESELLARQSDVFDTRGDADISDCTSELERVRSQYQDLCKRSNDYTKSLGAKQADAIQKLRHHDVRQFAETIGYSKAKVNLDQLRLAEVAEGKKVKDSLDRIRENEARITSLKAKMKDETRGAERVNEFLGNFFGHNKLTLRSVQSSYGARFEIYRGDNLAFNLSQGECSLIAFCYFIATLDDPDTSGSRPIIWIDDPVSSLDSNHVFFLFGLIRYQILRMQRFSQIFICTHHLDFLKFAMEITPDGIKRPDGAQVQNRYFLIERIQDRSIIKLMPAYFKNHVSEFIYLFDYLCKCSAADHTTRNGEELMAGYANNARKFLEIYLSYKYPGPIKFGERIRRFFGDNGVGAALIERLHHEYSHLDGRLERALMPLDVSEMKQCAIHILETIQRKDAEQFDALKAAVAA